MAETLLQIHILPIDDLREHEETRRCWCQPSVEVGPKGLLVVHNSADGRELVEQHGIN